MPHLRVQARNPNASYYLLKAETVADTGPTLQWLTFERLPLMKDILYICIQQTMSN
jgi:hypothetical protein